MRACITAKPATQTDCRNGASHPDADRLLDLIAKFGIDAKVSDRELRRRSGLDHRYVALAENFVAHALKLAPTTAMLLRLSFLDFGNADRQFSTAAGSRTCMFSASGFRCSTVTDGPDRARQRDPLRMVCLVRESRTNHRRSNLIGSTTKGERPNEG